MPPGPHGIGSRLRHPATTSRAPAPPAGPSTGVASFMRTEPRVRRAVWSGAVRRTPVGPGWRAGAGGVLAGRRGAGPGCSAWSPGGRGRECSGGSGSGTTRQAGQRASRQGFGRSGSTAARRAGVRNHPGDRARGLAAGIWVVGVKGRPAGRNQKPTRRPGTGPHGRDSGGRGQGTPGGPESGTTRRTGAGVVVPGFGVGRGQRSSGRARPVRAPTGSESGVPRGHQSSRPGSDS